jgi:hypothetical protein
MKNELRPEIFLIEKQNDLDNKIKEKNKKTNEVAENITVFLGSINNQLFFVSIFLGFHFGFDSVVQFSK